MSQGAEPGRVVAGRYQLVEILGAGGFGTVWKARDQQTDTAVALKEILLPAASGPERAKWLARAEREARHAVELRMHPNIVAVHGVVVEDGTPWILMELVVGRTLAQHLDAYGCLAPGQAVTVATGLLSALDTAHAAGIVHRDIKPSNVMLTDDGRVLLADFGIATRSTDTALTTTGTFLGSAEYTAPERARGEDGNAASDLFSLGVTLYQAVEGVSPFRRDLAMGSLYAVVNEPPPPMSRAGELGPLITRLLDKDPQRRPTAAQALAALNGTRTTFDQVVVRTPTLRSGMPPEEARAPRRPARSRVFVAAGVAAAVLAAVITLVVNALTDDSGGHGLAGPPGSPSSSADPDTGTPSDSGPTTDPTTEDPTPTTTPPTTEAPATTPAVRPLSSLVKPCDAPSTSVRNRFGMGTPDHVRNTTDLRQCVWSGRYGGAGIRIVMQYLTATSVRDWVGSASPVSVHGLPDAMEHIGTKSGQDPDSCSLWWPTTFGSIGVILINTQQGSATSCTDVEAFGTAAAPDLPH